MKDYRISNFSDFQSYKKNRVKDFVKDYTTFWGIPIGKIITILILLLFATKIFVWICECKRFNVYMCTCLYLRDEYFSCISSVLEKLSVMLIILLIVFVIRYIYSMSILKKINLCNEIFLPYETYLFYTYKLFVNEENVKVKQFKLEENENRVRILKDEQEKTEVFYKNLIKDKEEKYELYAITSDDDKSVKREKECKLNSLQYELSKLKKEAFEKDNLYTKEIEGLKISNKLTILERDNILQENRGLTNKIENLKSLFSDVELNGTSDKKLLSEIKEVLKSHPSKIRILALYHELLSVSIKIQTM